MCVDANEQQCLDRVNTDKRIEIMAADVAASALCPRHNPLRFSCGGFIAGCYLSCGVGGDHSANNHFLSAKQFGFHFSVFLSRV